MVKTTLVGPDITAAAEVLKTLDEAKFPITVAMWLLQKERSDWTFVIATPLYELGGVQAYDRLIDALSTKHPHALTDLPIRLEGNQRPMIKALRKAFGKAASVDGMRLGFQSFGGTWIDDAYVYRIKP